jgi:hypothetical protein
MGKIKQPTPLVSPSIAMPGTMRPHAVTPARPK